LALPRPANCVKSAAFREPGENLAVATGSLCAKEIENPLYVVEIRRQVAQDTNGAGEAMGAEDSLLRGIGGTQAIVQQREITGARQIGDDIVTDLYE
jgi:hypothetical protein